MDEILKFLLNDLSFVYKIHEFRIVNSKSSNTFGGEGYLILRSNSLEMRIVNDRGQLFLDFRHVSGKSTSDWYSIDLVNQLLTGNIRETAEMDGQYVSFLSEFLPEIVSVFDPTKIENTVSNLKKLKVVRAKRIFG